MTATAAPAGYRLALPRGWWSVDLDPSRSAASVRALVDHQWRGVDDAPHLKAQAREALLAQVQDAVAAGGLELHLCLDELDGVPLSASLLVAAVPLPSPSELADLAEARRRAGAEVGHAELGTGQALRTRWSEASTFPGVPADQMPTTTCLDVHVPVPGAPVALLLSFRTPLEPLADALVELFDAVASTLRWTA